MSPTLQVNIPSIEQRRSELYCELVIAGSITPCVHCLEPTAGDMVVLRFHSQHVYLCVGCAERLNQELKTVLSGSSS